MSTTRIMVFGTFDFLHKGHLNFFKQARKLAKHPFLIVSVARDTNVKKIKGQKPKISETGRLKTIKSCELVDKAVLGGKSKYLEHILKQKPQIIALGYDQRAYVKELKKDIKDLNLQIKVKKLKAFKPKIYKSSKMWYNVSN